MLKYCTRFRFFTCNSSYCCSAS